MNENEEDNIIFIDLISIFIRQNFLKHWRIEGEKKDKKKM